MLYSDQVIFMMMKWEVYHLPIMNIIHQITYPPTIKIIKYPNKSLEVVRQKASRDNNASPTNVTETPLGTSATENYLSDDDASIVVDDYGIVGLIRYNDEEDELLAPPLQPLSPILQVDLDKKTSTL